LILFQGLEICEISFENECHVRKRERNSNIKKSKFQNSFKCSLKETLAKLEFGILVFEFKF